MNLENTEAFLKKFGYNFTRYNNELVVNMPDAQCISLDFSKPDDVNITNKLSSWNYLTGLLRMELKYAFILNLIVTVLISIGLLFYDSNIGLIFFIAVTLWSVIWGLTYKSKIERFKQFLFNWERHNNLMV
ncbi:hypothetical protein [Aestuariibaculum sediminum]|uniref:Uncharacterized protein n=1 Tax=Aestuariibaculum sediminum TaxID=2770637 RepID=A0A8J6Q9Q1_9FLAO|nr:hypothetical protein [Aestuariibaculum sediminum]MBD0832677.1 hypothetical protein [Aestuariibaculum sediminum]